MKPEKPISDKAYIQYLEDELKTMTLLHNQCIKKVRSLEQYIACLNARAIRFTDSRLMSSQNSYAFRMNDILVKSVTRPGKNTVMMPFRLIKLVWEYIRRNKKAR